MVSGCAENSNIKVLLGVIAQPVGCLFQSLIPKSQELAAV
jgi:hypothetical protein